MAVTTPETDGRSRRWDAHRAERRTELCRLARRAVHHRGPDLSMDEMAAAMGTSKSIVYRYFTDKSGLQAAVGLVVLDEIADALEAAALAGGSARDRLHAMVEVYVRTLATSPNVYWFVTRDGSQPSAMATFLSRVSEYVAQPLRTACEERGLDPALAGPWAGGVVGFVRGVGEDWLAAPTRNRLDPEELIAHVSGWVWHGAAGPQPLPAASKNAPPNA